MNRKNEDSPASVITSLLSGEYPATELESESESELLYDWRFTTNQFILAPTPLRPTTSIFFN
jgi:hypothetical protein